MVIILLVAEPFGHLFDLSLSLLVCNLTIEGVISITDWPIRSVANPPPQRNLQFHFEQKNLEINIRGPNQIIIIIISWFTHYIIATVLHYLLLNVVQP